MATIVTKRHGFGECDIEAQYASNGHCDLRNFKCVRETSSLVVVWENKHLGFSSKASKRRCMQDAVTVAFETGAVRVFFFGDGSVAWAN
jgi:hypothetical protein